MIDRFVMALREADLAPDWRDLADVLWLADARAGRATAVRTAAVSGGEPLAAPPEPSQQPPAAPNAGEPAPSEGGRVSPRDSEPVAAHDVEPPAPSGWQLAERASEGAGLEAVAPARYALPGSQEIGRALRPLKQRRRTPRHRVFDPEATVELFCDTGVLAPVLRAGSERWFDVAVVADTSATMAVWDDTIAALADLLERHGAFRGVTRWGLTERDGAIEVVTPSGLAHRPHELLDIAGRRLVLVVTDAVDALWAHAGVWDAVRDWGEYGPVVLVQLLPPQSWAQTLLGEADVAVSAVRPGQPNRQLDVVPPWWWSESEPPHHVAPVVSLDETSLAPWARMVMGAAGVAVPGVVARPDDADGADSANDAGGRVVGAVAGSDVDLDRLGNVLRSTVSAQAYRLAVLLSAVEVSLPVARIVMHQLMPQARLAHLAELVAAGALRTKRIPSVAGSTGPAAPGSRTHRSEVALSFAPGLRELLQRSLTVTMTLQVWRAVAPYLEATRKLPRFSLLLQPSDAATTDSDDREGMRAIAADLAARLGLVPVLGVTAATPSPAAGSPTPATEPLAVWMTDSPMRELAAMPLPDGRTLLASGADDGTVRLWDPVTGTPVGQPLTGHTGWVGAVAAVALPDGRTLLASGAGDGTIRLWDPVTGTPVGQPLTGHTGRVRTVAAVALPDGRTLLASGADDGTIRLWDPVTGTPVGQPLTGHTGRVRTVAAVALPDGRTLLASGADDGTIRLWDPVTGSPVGQPLTGHTGRVRTVAAVALPDGRTLLASGADDGTIRLWDPVTGSPVGQPLTGHTGRVRTVAAVALPDGRTLLASAADDGTIRLWDPGTGTPVGQPLTGHTGRVRTVAAVALPDGRTLLASAADDGTIRLWDPGSAAQGEALITLVTALAGAGEYDRAAATAAAITDPHRRTQALADLVTALAEAGERERALQVAEDAATTAAAITDPHRRAEALTTLARALADIDPQHAARLAADVEAITRTITDPHRQAEPLDDGAVTPVSVEGAPIRVGPPISRVFGQPDPRTDAERLNDLRSIQRQATAIRTTRADPAFAERFIAGVRERRAEREDRTKFELIPDKYRGTALAGATDLHIRAEALPSVRRILDAYNLVEEPVAELDQRVVRLRSGQRDPTELANLATNLRQQGMSIAANYILMSMSAHGEGVASPMPTAGAVPVWPKSGRRKRNKDKSPARIVIIDTGVYGVRTDGWLTDLETKDNREDLDEYSPDGFLDLAAGQGSFCAGIVQQIAPEAHIVVSKQLDSDGLAHELRVARALVREVREGLEAGQHVIVNLSFGTETTDDEQPIALGVALEIIDEESRGAGLDTIVVAAAGNFGHDRPCYPAAFPTVTAVAALTQGMLPAEWSSRGAWVDVCTIGEGVRSTFVPGRLSQSVDSDIVEFPNNAWALWSSTSFAAPQVAAAIAKIAIEEDVTPTEAKRRLLEGAQAIRLYGKQVEILPRI